MNLLFQLQLNLALNIWSRGNNAYGGQRIYMSVAVQSNMPIFVGRVCMIVWWSYIASLSHEFFSKQYTFVCIQHMSPCSSPQHSLLRDQTWGGGSTHGEPPLAIPLMIFMTTQQPSNWGSKWRLDWFSHETSTKLDLNGGTSHTTNCMFSECVMPIWSYRSGLWISLNPLCEPPSLHLVWGMHHILTKFWVCT